MYNIDIIKNILEKYKVLQLHFKLNDTKLQKKIEVGSFWL